MRMNPVILCESGHDRSTASRQSSRLPMWLKLSFTAFMAVLVPVHWSDYVLGMDNAQPQTWLPQPLYLCVWIVTLFTLTTCPHISCYAGCLNLSPLKTDHEYEN